MIGARAVLREVMLWSLLAAVLISGMVGLAGAVEAAHLGAWSALLVAVSGVPSALVMLSPTLAAAGSAAALARMDARGERLTLAVAGFHPARAVGVALLAGALVGVGQRALSDHVVWRAQALTEATLPEPALDWVWLDGGAYRAADQVWVSATLEVEHAHAVPAAQRSVARMQQRPRSASRVALRDGEGHAIRLERHSRPARGVACAAAAGIAWLPAGLAGLRRLGMMLALVLVWQAADAVLYAAAAQGQLSAALGGWTAAAGLAFVLGIGVLRLR